MKTQTHPPISKLARPGWVALVAALAAVAFASFTLLGTAQAAVTIDASSVPSGWKTGTGANTITFSPAFTFTPAANGMLVVTVSGEANPSSTPTVTYDGTAMTLAVSGYTNVGYAGVWYMPSPAVGNGALVVTVPGTVTRYNVYAAYAAE
jgi:hypothetical protein